MQQLFLLTAASGPRPAVVCCDPVSVGAPHHRQTALMSQTSHKISVYALKYTFALLNAVLKALLTQVCF